MVENPPRFHHDAVVDLSGSAQAIVAYLPISFLRSASILGHIFLEIAISRLSLVPSA